MPPDPPRREARRRSGGRGGRGGAVDELIRGRQLDRLEEHDDAGDGHQAAPGYPEQLAVPLGGAQQGSQEEAAQQEEQGYAHRTSHAVPAYQTPGH